MALIIVDQFIGRLFLILAIFLLAVAILAWPPRGVLFRLPALLFLAAAFSGLVGGLFFFAAKGLRRDTSWQWIAQGAAVLVVLCIALLTAAL
ncbi:MAG: hypothetical protein FJ217_04240 [Ignavibacteria bacterium]|nr:hypothetical protein [Ignavibacteria bacterium]